jgi:hypothetical protein
LLFCVGQIIIGVGLLLSDQRPGSDYHRVVALVVHSAGGVVVVTNDGFV